MAPLPEQPARPGNLPGALSLFIGRRREMAEVERRLADYRLLTLTGPGGSGKTRLALEVGRAVQPGYPDGVWLVELAALGEGELVAQTVATALGVSARADEVVSAALIAYLRARRILLLLDNCEHLVDACAHLAELLLSSCPDIHILATSREPLAVPGEGVWPVPPLSLPTVQPWRGPENGPATLESYRQSEAVQLFEARARAALPSFELTMENGPWTAEICRRLDGLPLALELAAAHVRAYPVRTIAQHLDDRLQLFKARTRTALPRHQTLEAALDWSYALLSDAEQQVLQQLSVFAGGWTLDAAEAVCAPDAGVMPLLSNLIAKSLVVVDHAGGGRRYHFLETIRQYAQRKLAAAGQAGATRDRHLAYFVRWAESSGPFLVGPEQSRWVAEFELDHDNLRAALDWCGVGAGKEELGLRLAAACGDFWNLRGHLTEGRERLAAVLAAAGPEMRTTERAWALIWAAHLAYLQSDFTATEALAHEALAIYRGLGPAGRVGVALALDWLGEVATEVGDYENAPGYLEEALLIYREVQDNRGAADMLMQLGWALMRMGDYVQAEAYLHESLLLVQALDDPYLLGMNLSGLGELALRQGEYDRAHDLLRESLVARRALGNPWGIAVSLGSLGWVALRRGEFIPMAEALEESLQVRLEIGDRGGVAWCLEKLAEAKVLLARRLSLPHRRRAFPDAIRILGAAAAVRAEVNAAIDPVDQPAYDELLDELRQTVGGEGFDAAWAAGSRLSLPEAVEQALAAVRPGGTAALPPREADKAQYGGLSRRERETARLIALGKSNSEIAAAMTVGVKTVETYVTRILNKLGLESRVQIAVWAVEKGLASTRK